MARGINRGESYPRTNDRVQLRSVLVNARTTLFSMFTGQNKLPAKTPETQSAAASSIHILSPEASAWPGQTCPHDPCLAPSPSLYHRV